MLHELCAKFFCIYYLYHTSALILAGNVFMVAPTNSSQQIGFVAINRSQQIEFFYHELFP